MISTSNPEMTDMIRRGHKPPYGALAVSVYLAIIVSAFSHYVYAAAIEPVVASATSPPIHSNDMVLKRDDYSCFNPTPNVLAYGCTCYNIGQFAAGQGTAVAISLAHYDAAIDVFCADFASRYTFGLDNKHTQRRGMAYFYMPNDTRLDNPDRSDMPDFAVALLLAVSHDGTRDVCKADFHIEPAQCRASLQNILTGCQHRERWYDLSVGGWGQDQCLSWTLDPWPRMHNYEVYMQKIKNMGWPYKKDVADDAMARAWNSIHRDAQSYVLP